MAASTLIIGGGIAGLATAWNLARRGVRNVTLLEQRERVGSESSAKSAGILRTVGTDSITNELARRGGDFLGRPPDGFTKKTLLDSVGLILTGERGVLKDQLRSDNVRELDGDEVRALAPHYHGPREEAWLLRGNGRIDVRGVLAAFESATRRAGVTIRTRAKVARLKTEGQAVRGAILEGGEEFRADWTVLAAGAWAGKLGKSAGSGVRLSPTRRHLWVSEKSDLIPTDAPIVWRLGEEEFYCRPEAGALLACGCETDPVDDPDACAPDQTVRERIRARLAANTPELEGLREARFWCGMRTATVDGRFAIGPDPDLGGLFWVAGLGGWGMSTGAAVGRLAADLLLEPEAEPAFSDALAPGRLV